MSSDDYIIIDKTTFKIYYCQGYKRLKNDLIGKAKSLEKAITFAEQWQEKNKIWVEYGIRFIK